MTDVVSVVRADDRWVCHLRDGSFLVAVRIHDAHGNLIVTGADVDTGRSRLPFSRLSKLARDGRWEQTAIEAVAHQRGRRLVTGTELAARPFLEDRRGRAKRSDSDYVWLADLYVSATYSGDPRRDARGRVKRHELAGILAERHGGSVITWRKRLALAKALHTEDAEFTDEDGTLWRDLALTDSAMRLLYGKNYRVAFATENARDEEAEAAESLIRRHQAPESDAERALAAHELRRHGAQEIARRLDAAQRVLDTYGQSRP